MSEILSRFLTKKGILKHQSVFMEWVKGEEVECKSSFVKDEWNVVDCPDFDPNLQYRVKPQPRKVWIIVHPSWTCTHQTKEEAEGLIKQYPNTYIQEVVIEKVENNNE